MNFLYSYLELLIKFYRYDYREIPAVYELQKFE